MNNCSTLPRPQTLTPSLLQRLIGGWSALRAWWAERAAGRQQEREIDAAADLSERTLRDIGAPDWLREQAAARRESNLQRLFEMRMNALGHNLPPDHRW